eukprot:SM000062S19912  [mRNA]  locus=s62:323189:328432:+ [translate_table: standard]
MAMEAAQQMLLGGGVEWPSPDDSPPFWQRKPQWRLLAGGTIAGGAGRAAPVEPDAELLHIVHVTAEMAPLAKVGGLGDVVTGLARACLARGHCAEVMLPFYECLDCEEIVDLRSGAAFGTFHRGGHIHVNVSHGTVAGVPVTFLKPANNFFDGGRIYGGSYNETEAYLFFSRACLELMHVTGQHPDIIHIHEWHVCSLPLLYWDVYHHMGLQKPRLILTIHNMEHQGECRPEQLDMCGLHGASYLDPNKAIDDRTIGHNPERLSLLKGGIVYSNAVSTVSPTYAQETLCSGWLSNTLLKYCNKYSGVLNGIDMQLWDPEHDNDLPAPYSASNLVGKEVCKHYLQQGLGLDPCSLPPLNGSAASGSLSPVEKRVPLVICVTRLVAQKGVHLIRHAIFRTRELGGQFVLLGSSPVAHIQADFQRLSDELKGSGDVRILLTYSEPLSHLLFGAGDVILVPSMFEPCGLTQMIGMRYGTIPVVRRTGGLADTVQDVDSEAAAGSGNGFVFDGIDERSMDTALDRCLRYYQERPDWWSELTARVMGTDNSWNKSAGEYVSLYNSIRVRQ